MTRLYKLSDGAPLPVAAGRLQREGMIQDWIEQKPELMGLDLLIIGREVATADGGSIDLLGIDDEGNLAILELKRDRTPRDVIAQVLDYASWATTLSEREVKDIAQTYLKRNLEHAFRERFKTTLPDELNNSHTMVIIASAFDPSSQRIVRYLSETHDIAINTAFFTIFDDGGQLMLTTDWFLDQSEVAERSAARVQVSTEHLATEATDRKVTQLVEICRKLSSAGMETTAPAYGGSLRYWLKNRMIFGVNVAGGRRKPPLGELDVWIPTTRFSEVVAIPADEIRATLKRDFGATESGTTDLLIRLKVPDDAERLVTVLLRWINAPTTPNIKDAVSA
jgi:hypothetical protein